MKNFAQLFAGGTECYTVLRYVPGSNLDGNKLEGGVETFTQPPTADLYDAHTAGKRSIGIVPIRSDGTVSFVVLDVDVYGHEQSIETAKRIQRVRGCPFIPCLSKSDGLHLFAFYDTPVPAKDARELAKSWAEKLGIKAEIFPKSDKPEGLGNAINLPYFGDKRPALDIDGNTVSLPEFLDFANSLLIRVAAPKAEKREVAKSPLDTGPPCLQSRLNEHPVDDHRTDWLYQTAVFLFKKYGDVETMGEKLQEYNDTYFHRPVDQRDQIHSLKKSFGEKKYGFKCKPDWAAERCNSQECMKRAHGIRGSGAVGFTDQEAEITEIIELYKNTGAPQYLVTIYDKEVFFDSLENITNLTMFINAVFIATGKNLEWQGKNTKEFPAWIRKEIASKGKVDEKSDNEFLALEGIVLAKFKGWVRSRLGQDHKNPNEPHVMHIDGRIWAPVLEFMEQIDKLRVALDKKFNRKHINTVLFKFGCEVLQWTDGEPYYVVKPWFTPEDKRAKDRPHT